MKKRFGLCLLAVLICTSFTSTVLANTETSSESLDIETPIDPRGYSQVSYAASVTNRWNGTTNRGTVLTWKNTTTDAGAQTFSKAFSVSNGYSSEMGSASKSAIQTAVGYDLSYTGQRQWNYTVAVPINKTVNIGLTDKYLCQDVSVTQTYEVWLGNSLYPTVTKTYGTGWAKQWYAYECYHSFS